MQGILRMIAAHFQGLQLCAVAAYSYAEASSANCVRSAAVTMVPPRLASKFRSARSPWVVASARFSTVLGAAKAVAARREVRMDWKCMLRLLGVWKLEDVNIFVNVVVKDAEI